MSAFQIVKYNECPICGEKLSEFIAIDDNVLSAGGSYDLRRQCEYPFGQEGIRNFHFKERLLGWSNKKFSLQTIRLELVNASDVDYGIDSELCDIEYRFDNDDITKPKMSVMANEWKMYNFHYKVNSFTTSKELQDNLRRLGHFK